MAQDRQDSGKKGFELDRLDLSHLKDILVSDVTFGRKPPDPGATIIESIFNSIGEIDSFLSFSRQLDEINNILKMEYASTREIADVLLKDFALTSKLLKLANSPFYLQFNHKGITTISEAMIILGTDQIQHTAANLLFFEFMQGLSKNRELMSKTITSFMRGIVAREIASRTSTDRYEEYQICAMLYDFGEYILLFLYPGKHREVEYTMERHTLDREEASRKVLGMSYSRIGRAIALKWGIPQKIVQTMKPLTYVPKTRTTVSQTDMKLYVSAMASDLCSLDWYLEFEEEKTAVKSIVERYKSVVSLTPAMAEEILDFGRNSVIQHASILGIDLENSLFSE